MALHSNPHFPSNLDSELLWQVKMKWLVGVEEGAGGIGRWGGRRRRTWCGGTRERAEEEEEKEEEEGGVLGILDGGVVANGNTNLEIWIYICGG